MGYFIKAKMVKSLPQLKIIDAESGSTCFEWRYGEAGCLEEDSKKEIKRLFKQLFILGCKAQLLLETSRQSQMRPTGTSTLQRIAKLSNSNQNQRERA